VHSDDDDVEDRMNDPSLPSTIEITPRSSSPESEDYEIDYSGCSADEDDDPGQPVDIKEQTEEMLVEEGNPLEPGEIGEICAVKMEDELSDDPLYCKEEDGDELFTPSENTENHIDVDELKIETVEESDEDYEPAVKKKKKKARSKEKKFACTQCDYRTNHSGHLNIHRESKHEGVRYKCDQCDFAAISKSYLTYHKESKHDGIRYPCETCGFGAISLSNLRAHKRAKHEGRRFSCDQCDILFTRASNLKRHKMATHNVST